MGILFIVLLVVINSDLTEDNLYKELASPLDAFYEYYNGTFILTKPYRIKPIDLTRTYIKIRINPCKGKTNEFCCEGMNEGMCQDNPVISKGPNLPIAWSCNNFIVICNNEFFEREECGTFIEVHLPNSTDIINQIRITTFYKSGFHTESIYTRELLPGYYELWWTQRDRTGRWILYIKPFYIAY
ncbi:hypothetical protein SteCoe_30945 [Stentor coeruleus]|uniref:Uncharacterized protein n=1 Tax=Stentor coeruleus TaxID=5963 RepID=A0A1R2B2G1_9CILI|nr:hypothetical protein SteCoe_30945 [Stentor coeruleus]